MMFINAFYTLNERRNQRFALSVDCDVCVQCHRGWQKHCSQTDKWPDRLSVGIHGSTCSPSIDRLHWKVTVCCRVWQNRVGRQISCSIQMLWIRPTLTTPDNEWFCTVDSAPSLGVYYFFVVDSVCMSECLSRSFKSILLFCFSMESSHFWAVSSPCGTLQNVVLRFLI